MSRILLFAILLLSAEYGMAFMLYVSILAILQAEKLSRTLRLFISHALYAGLSGNHSIFDRTKEAEHGVHEDVEKTRQAVHERTRNMLEAVNQDAINAAESARAKEGTSFVNRKDAEHDDVHEDVEKARRAVHEHTRNVLEALNQDAINAADAARARDNSANERARNDEIKGSGDANKPHKVCKFPNGARGDERESAGSEQGRATQEDVGQAGEALPIGANERFTRAKRSCT